MERKNNNVNKILSEILTFDDKIEKLNMELRSEFLSKNRLESKSYFQKLNLLIKDYEISLENIQKSNGAQIQI